MTIYDQHVHSYLSFDCDENPENYLTEATKELVLTDHFDLNNPVTAFQDDVPDFDQLLEIKANLKETHDVTLRLGVEVGYAPGLANQIQEKLAAYPFEVILLSCHHNNQDDYMDESIKAAVADPIAAYFDQMIEAIAAIPQANILAHFDYGTRIHQLTVEGLKKYQDRLETLFVAAIQADLAFELNSKSMYRYGNFDLYDYAIPLYQSLGGRLFTLGSDAHQAADLELDFDKSKALLKKHGVTEVVVYRQGHREQMPLS